MESKWSATRERTVIRDDQDVGGEGVRELGNEDVSEVLQVVDGGGLGVVGAAVADEELARVVDRNSKALVLVQNEDAGAVGQDGRRRRGPSGRRLGVLDGLALGEEEIAARCDLEARLAPVVVRKPQGGSSEHKPTVNVLPVVGLAEAQLGLGG